MGAAEVVYIMLVSGTSLNDSAPIPAISSLHLEVGSEIDKVCTCGYWTDYGTNSHQPASCQWLYAPLDTSMCAPKFCTPLEQLCCSDQYQTL